MKSFLGNLKEQWAAILICFAFVGIVIIFYPLNNAFMSWLIILFFGLGGLVLLFKPFIPTPQPTSHQSTNTSSINKESDVGIFNFDKPELFSIWNEGFEVFFHWAHIETLIGYIDDDQTALQVYFKDKSHILFNNFTNGWYKFHTELHQRIPSVSATWFDREKAFDKVILYDRRKRNTQTIEEECFYDSF